MREYREKAAKFSSTNSRFFIVSHRTFSGHDQSNSQFHCHGFSTFKTRCLICSRPYFTSLHLGLSFSISRKAREPFSSHSGVSTNSKIRVAYGSRPFLTSERIFVVPFSEPSPRPISIIIYKRSRSVTPGVSRTKTLLWY